MLSSRVEKQMAIRPALSIKGRQRFGYFQKGPEVKRARCKMVYRRRALGSRDMPIVPIFLRQYRLGNKFRQMWVSRCISALFG